MSRKIVYLDHSVLSNFAKDRSSAVHGELLALVEQDSVIFPYSWTHHDEAELDDRWAEEIQDVGATLSRGVEFRPTIQIVAAQAGDAYMEFAGKEKEERVPWHVFDHDPHGDIQPELADNKRRGGVVSSVGSRIQRRELKEQFAASLLKTREDRDTSSTSFDEIRASFQEEALDLYFRNPWRTALSAGSPPFPDSAMLNYGTRAADSAFGVGHTPMEVLRGTVSFLEFLKSDALSNIPFIHLESAILASLEADEPNRNYLAGDIYDVETWATYLPYVDVAVADGNMAQVLNRRGLAADYGCKIFAHSNAGLMALVQELRQHGVD